MQKTKRAKILNCEEWRSWIQTKVWKLSTYKQIHAKPSKYRCEAKKQTNKPKTKQKTTTTFPVAWVHCILATKFMCSFVLFWFFPFWFLNVCIQKSLKWKRKTRTAGKKKRRNFFNLNMLKTSVMFFFFFFFSKSNIWVVSDLFANQI